MFEMRHFHQCYISRRVVGTSILMQGDPSLLRPLAWSCPESCGCTSPEAAANPPAYCPRSCFAWNTQQNQRPKKSRLEKILLMEEILHQLRLVVYPIIYRVLYIPGGAGFLPSTVWPPVLRLVELVGNWHYFLVNSDYTIWSNRYMWP